MTFKVYAVLAVLAGTTLPRAGLAKVTVTLYSVTSGGATQVGSPLTFSDGASISVSDGTFGLTAGQAQGVNRVVITGGAGAYTGPISIGLSTSGTTPTSVNMSSIADCGGLSASSPGSRPIVLTLSNITGDIAVGSVAAVQVESCTLFASHLGSGGSVYEPLHTARLG